MGEEDSLESRVQSALEEPCALCWDLELHSGAPSGCFLRKEMPVLICVRTVCLLVFRSSKTTNSFPGIVLFYNPSSQDRFRPFSRVRLKVSNFLFFFFHTQ